ncbi:Cytosolic iron-sulfur protein assembly protein [Coelomomyces lativittatus]|nr:Cytosolic iron-sulfur protein assembly protein [Coelomomyces lativittatus]
MASFDTTISIWQKDTLASEDGVWTYEYVGTLEGHEHEVKSVSWSPDGSLLATASRDKTIWIWEVLEENDFECLSVLHDHTQDVKCVKWHPTQEILVSSSYDDTLRVWKDIEDDWTRIHLLQGHTSTVWSFDFDPKGDYLVSCSEDTSLRLWRFHSPEQIQLLQIIPHAHTQAIYSVSWHPHLPYLAVGSGDKSISIWECILEEHPPNPSFSPHLVCRFRCTTSYEINAVAWNPSLMYSSILASCDDHGDVHLWELQCLHPWSHVVLESEIKTRMDT